MKNAIKEAFGIFMVQAFYRIESSEVRSCRGPFLAIFDSGKKLKTQVKLKTGKPTLNMERNAKLESRAAILGNPEFL